MTEQEIMYSILEIVRNNEITDDDRLTEAFLRNLMYTYRAEAIKEEWEISEEMYQSVELEFFQKDVDNGVFESLILPDILYNKSRGGIIMNDLYGRSLPIIPKEEAIISQASRFFRPLYVAFIQSSKMVIKANLEKLDTAPAIDKDLLVTLRSRKPKIEISCILNKPTDSPNYNWKRDPFPFAGIKTAAMKQKILRQEFGIMFEVKKDEIQNARADDVIYQDESKLYK